MFNPIIVRTLLPLAVVLIGLPAGATKLKKDPRHNVEAALESIRKQASTAPSKKALNSAITKILDGMVDWDAFSSKTLGKTLWSELTSAQHQTFISAYKKLITRKYAGRFKPRPKRPFEVTFRGKTKATKFTAVVKTTVFTFEDGKKVGVDVDYHFVLTKGRHRVGDIVTDTVSRALSYRQKFKTLHRKRGFEALVKRIEKNAARP